MKHIVKQAEPAAFTMWKTGRNSDWQPTYNDLPRDVKKTVKDALMIEQGYLCCYCERRLGDDDSHIEHFRPQSDPATDSLDFANLLCSCQNQVNKGDPRHCGNSKADWFSDQWLTSPLDPECEARFAYTFDGRIKPASQSDRAAAETISKLKLDIQKLRALRAGAIGPFLDEELTPDDIHTFVTGYLERDADGRFEAFWTTIRYLFGELHQTRQGPEGDPRGLYLKED
jgi:uncharacterized protein (TIGR02646 family)